MDRNIQMDKAFLEWTIKMANNVYHGADIWYAAVKWADTHPQWIHVEERLPEENQSVFICNARRDYGTALYQGGEWILTREYVAINVTHWMPIVPPRKEDKE